MLADSREPSHAQIEKKIVGEETPSEFVARIVYGAFYAVWYASFFPWVMLMDCGFISGSRVRIFYIFICSVSIAVINIFYRFVISPSFHYSEMIYIFYYGLIMINHIYGIVLPHRKAKSRRWIARLFGLYFSRVPRSLSTLMIPLTSLGVGLECALIYYSLKSDARVLDCDAKFGEQRVCFEDGFCCFLIRQQQNIFIFLGSLVGTCFGIWSSLKFVFLMILTHDKNALKGIRGLQPIQEEGIKKIIHRELEASNKKDPAQSPSNQSSGMSIAGKSENREPSIAISLAACSDISGWYPQSRQNSLGVVERPDGGYDMHAMEALKSLQGDLYKMFHMQNKIYNAVASPTFDSEIPNRASQKYHQRVVTGISDFERDIPQIPPTKRTSEYQNTIIKVDTGGTPRKSKARRISRRISPFPIPIVAPSMSKNSSLGSNSNKSETPTMSTLSTLHEEMNIPPLRARDIQNELIVE